MAFENVSWIWRKPTYFLTWLITTLVVAWLYIGALTNPEAYDALGWFFAVAFPILTGATLAVQVANYRERKGCPVGSTGGGLTGGHPGCRYCSLPGLPIHPSRMDRSGGGRSKLCPGRSMAEAFQFSHSHSGPLLGQQ